MKCEFLTVFLWKMIGKPSRSRGDVKWPSFPSRTRRDLGETLADYLGLATSISAPGVGSRLFRALSRPQLTFPSVL